MAAKLKIKKGDKVVVMTGRDKGKSGDVVAVFPKENYQIGDFVDVIVKDCTSATLLGTALGISENI